jgi:hypothetical protein
MAKLQALRASPLQFWRPNRASSLAALIWATRKEPNGFHLHSSGLSALVPLTINAGFGAATFSTFEHVHFHLGYSPFIAGAAAGAVQAFPSTLFDSFEFALLRRKTTKSSLGALGFYKKSVVPQALGKALGVSSACDPIAFALFFGIFEQGKVWWDECGLWKAGPEANFFKSAVCGFFASFACQLVMYPATVVKHELLLEPNTVERHSMFMRRVGRKVIHKLGPVSLRSSLPGALCLLVYDVIRSQVPETI